MSLNLRKLILAVTTPVLLLCTLSVAAHHSAAQFNLRERVTIKGVVKKFTVRNPHAMIILEITDDERGTRDVEFEGHSASHFYRAGYTRGLVKEGDEIAILYSPRYDGEDGGFIHAFTANDTTVIGFGNQAPES